MDESYALFLLCQNCQFPIANSVDFLYRNLEVVHSKEMYHIFRDDTLRPRNYDGSLHPTQTVACSSCNHKLGYYVTGKALYVIFLTQDPEINENQEIDEN